MNFLRNIILLSFCLFQLSAQADQITIDKFKIVTDSKPNKDKIIVKNITENEAYVTVEVFKMIKQEGKFKELKVEDFSKEHIIVSPSKIILKPKGNKKDQKSVDIITIGKPLEEEIVYKVRFKPVVEDEDSNSLLILIAYETYVFVQPLNKKFDYKIEKLNNGTTIRNTGNTSFYIKDINKCNVKTKKCMKKENKNLLPSSVVLIKSEPDVKTNFSIINYKEEIVKIETE